MCTVNVVYPELRIVTLVTYFLFTEDWTSPWILGAAQCLCARPKVFNTVVPTDDNQLNNGFKAGIFHFRFWRYGEWIDVVVDDRLPTVKGKLAGHDAKEDINDFWPALLEKAYAKMYGSYEALEKGFSGDTFLEFTGAFIETFKPKEIEPEELFEITYKATQLYALIGCTTPPAGKVDLKGLLPSHGYSITNVLQFEHKGLCE